MLYLWTTLWVCSQQKLQAASLIKASVRSQLPLKMWWIINQGGGGGGVGGCKKHKCTWKGLCHKSMVIMKIRSECGWKLAEKNVSLEGKAQSCNAWQMIFEGKVFSKSQNHITAASSWLLSQSRTDELYVCGSVLYFFLRRRALVSLTRLIWVFFGHRPSCSNQNQHLQFPVVLCRVDADAE